MFANQTWLARGVRALGLMLLLATAACGGMTAEPQIVEVTRVVTQTEVVEVPMSDMAEMETVVEVEVTREVEVVVGSVSVEQAEEEPAAPRMPEPQGLEAQDYGVNPFVTAATDTLSTFAIDVDTGAYTLMRNYVDDNILPPPNAVRVEEFVNYFDQQYPIPQDGAFAVHLEAAPSPYGAGYHLLRVGIQGYEVAEEDRPNALLIFVVDVSGSMDDSNRLPLVKLALAELVENLRPTDEIGIVRYGDVAEVVLLPTAVADKTRILNAIDSLQITGSTNMEDGLRLAYDLADLYAQPGNINRLIVASDGGANVGATTAESILQHAEAGTQLSTFGFGMGSYNDTMMEQLSNQGDGSYAFIDDLGEARRVFHNQLLSTILTIAKDAKVQVEFNPNVISEYRLIGYENRDVADSDFRNDAVDAGEIGAGHSVTALYEVRFVEGANVNEAAVTARVRYEDPETAEVTEIAQSMAVRDVHAQFTDATPTFQLSAVVAEYGELLRQSFWAQDGDWGVLMRDAQRIAEYFPVDGDVQEFANLVVKAGLMNN